MIERWRMMDEIYPGHPQWPASNIATHGTFRQFTDSICKHGLQAGGLGGKRADNHFVAQINTKGADQPGLRENSDTIVFVHMDRHRVAGNKFFISHQHVILTSQTVHPDHIRNIVD